MFRGVLPKQKVSSLSLGVWSEFRVLDQGRAREATADGRGVGQADGGFFVVGIKDQGDSMRIAHNFREVSISDCFPTFTTRMGEVYFSTRLDGSLDKSMMATGGVMLKQAAYEM